MTLHFGFTRVAATAQPRVHSQTVADLHQLSGVTAFSIIGICLSLMTLTFADGGQWLLTLAEGF